MNNKILAIVVFILMGLVGTYAIANESILYPFENEADSTRFESLLKEVRCVVCQNQNLMESNAPIAQDLKTQIYHLVKNNVSNEEILENLSHKFGDFILYQPPFKLSTLLLWLFPWIGIILGLKLWKNATCNKRRNVSC